MQKTFDAKTTPKEYHRQGKNFPFPKLNSCPCCKKPIPPEKNGFYERNARDGEFSEKILIRRYWCIYCRTSISFLPSFCLPWYQNTLKIVFATIHRIIGLEWKPSDCLKSFAQEYPSLFLQRQHLEFYVRRFIKNTNLIKLGLRQLISDVELPPEGDKKEAQKILRIVSGGFKKIHAFSQRFFEQCNFSFMASR